MDYKAVIGKIYWAFDWVHESGVDNGETLNSTRIS